MSAKKKSKSEKPTNPMLVKGILTSAIATVCLTLLFGAFALYGVISMWGARVILVIAWCIAVGGVLLSDVIWIKPRRFKIYSTSIAAIVFGFAAWGIDTWAVKTKERHLTQEQRQGLAKLRDSIPGNCGILVYVPIESPEAQNFGKEIHEALQIYGKRANMVYEGAMAPPTGVVVGVRSSLEPCGFAGEMLSVQMDHDLHMAARLQESWPNSDETTIILFVGIKPSYD